MKESFLDRAKVDGQVFVKTVTLLTKLSKLKLEIATKQKERKHLLGVIGGAVFDIYKQANGAGANVILDAVRSHFESLRHLDEGVLKLESEFKQVKASFKSSGPTSTQSNSSKGDA